MTGFRRVPERYGQAGIAACTRGAAYYISVSVMRRAITLASIAVPLLVAGAAVVYVRREVVPPGCRDRAVLAIVRRVLIDRARLPPALRLHHIVTVAGGPLAFRFVCDAGLRGLARQLLPPGPRPGGVRYTIRLAGARHRLSVRVRLVPLLEWVAMP